MLEIRKGKSSQPYENEFFREFSARLSQLFKEKNWDGLLLGMPECLLRDDLQIDALLVTNRRIIIIDFKNYEGELSLPAEIDEFENGEWKIDDDVIVMGGGSINPFRQLGKQRGKLIGLLKKRLKNFDRKSISTMVVFQKEVKLNGDIPGKWQASFTIADRQNFVNKIFDLLDIEEENRHYLSPENQNIFKHVVFSTDRYDPESAVDLEKMPIIRQVKPKKIHDHILKGIQEFLHSDSRVLLLTGTAGSGKSSLIPYIRKLGFEAGFVEAPVLAYSTRLRKKLLNRHPDLEDVESLYHTIYDFSSERLDENYMKIVPLRTYQEDSEIDHSGRILYIIHDSHLISNSIIQSGFVQFGSGRLLDDLLAYVDLNNNPDMKIIFIGDKNKLSYGSSKENALNAEYVQSLLESRKVLTTVTEIELPDKPAASEIIKFTQKIARCLQNKQFNYLVIDSSKKEITVSDRREEIKALHDVYQNPFTAKYIVYTNEQARELNQKIKQSFIQNGFEINTGDQIVFHASTYAYPASQRDRERDFSEPIRIYNGTFGKVLSVDRRRTVVKNVRVNNRQKVQLRFIPARIELQDGTIVDMLVFENFLNSQSSELDRNELIAVRILLSQLEKQAFEKEPFANSPEYQRMKESGDYVAKQKSDHKVLYRDPEDRRRITKYEKEYRKRIFAKLNRKNSEYFQILNAAQIKYAWCMTVHKAMAYEFDRIYFDTDQGENRGKTNADYFRWLYTGMLIGRQHVSVINWQPISPFLKTEFNENPPRNISKIEHVIMKFTKGTEQTAAELRAYLASFLPDINGKIIHIDSRQYLEMVTFEVEKEKVQLFFDYNKRGEVKLPRYKSGSKQAYQKILDAIQIKSEEILDEMGLLKDVFSELAERLGQKGIKTRFISGKQWEKTLQFANLNEQVYVQVWHKADGLISSFNYLQGSMRLFKDIVSTIRTIYQLDLQETPLYTEKDLRDDLYKISTTYYVNYHLLRNYIFNRVHRDDLIAELSAYKDKEEINTIFQQLNQVLYKIQQNGGKVAPDPVMAAIQLRKAGKLEEAKNTIIPYIEKNPQDERAKTSFGWIMYDFLKKAEDNIDRYCQHLELFNRYITIDFHSPNEYMKTLKDAIFWSIYRVVKDSEENTNKIFAPFIKLCGNFRGAIFEKRTGTAQYRDPARLLVKEFFRNLDSKNYFQFVNYIGFDWFTRRDYECTTFTNNQGETIQLRPLAEWILNFHAKKLFAADDVTALEIDRYILILEQEIEKNPSFEWLPFYKIKLLIKNNRKKEAYEDLLQFARKKRKEFWVWDLFSEVVPEEEKFKYLCKALLCRAKPEMLVGVQEKIIPYLIQNGLYSHARFELDSLIAIRERNGWPISRRLMGWKNEAWYTSTDPAPGREGLYQFAREAEKVLYQAIPPTDVFVTYINTEKGTIHFLYALENADHIRDGYFYMDSIDEKIDWKTNHMYTFTMEKDSRHPKRYRVYEVTAGDQSLARHFIQRGNGYVKKYPENPFAFVNGIYIPPKLVEKYNISDQDQIEYIAKRKYNKKKLTWGWAVEEVVAITKNDTQLEVR